jgi:hypothetical protein
MLSVYLNKNQEPSTTLIDKRDYKGGGGEAERIGSLILNTKFEDNPRAATTWSDFTQFNLFYSFSFFKVLIGNFSHSQRYQKDNLYQPSE